MEWAYNWPSGVLREQILTRLSREELLELERNFSAYLRQAQANYLKKRPKPKVSTLAGPKKVSKVPDAEALQRIFTDAERDYKVIGDRVKRVLATGRR